MVSAKPAQKKRTQASEIVRTLWRCCNKLYLGQPRASANKEKIAKVLAEDVSAVDEYKLQRTYSNTISALDGLTGNNSEPAYVPTETEEGYFGICSTKSSNHEVMTAEVIKTVLNDRSYHSARLPMARLGQAKHIPVLPRS